MAEGTNADDRERRLADLHAQLAAGREQLRHEREAQEAALAGQRDKLRRMRDRVRPLHRQVREDRRKARMLLARFFAHMKRRWSAERLAVATERADLDRCRKAFAEESAAFEAEQTRFRAEAAEYQKRLKAAWELLTEGQRRLLADREEVEKTLAERAALLDVRTRDVEAREHAATDGRAQAEARVRELLAEGDRLEARTVRAREVLAELEAKRAATEAGLAAASGAASAVPDTVALDRRADGASVERVFAELQARDRDLTRERHYLTAARAELESQAADLADGRLVLAEQTASLAAVRDRLCADQRQALLELESVARAVHAREQAAAARERAAEDADRRNRRREAELIQFRLRLDAWQSSLTVAEQASSVARGKEDLELAERRDHLARWEAALTTLCHKWAGVRKRERAALHDELGRWSAARSRYEAALVSLDRTRSELLADAAVAAEKQLAAEQMLNSLSTAGPKAARRLRVMRKAWEVHFTRFRRELDARHVALAAETADAQKGAAELHAALIDLAHRRAELTAAEQMSESARLALERELDERAATIPIEAARARRAEEALAAVRDEVDRVAAAVLAAGPDAAAVPPADRLPPGVVRLQLAPRAAA